MPVTSSVYTTFTGCIKIQFKQMKMCCIWSHNLLLKTILHTEKILKKSSRSGPGQHRWTYIMVNILLFLVYPYYSLRNRFKYSILNSVHKKCKTLGMVRLKIIFATYTMTTNLKCVLLKQKWRQSWEGE